MNFFTKSLLGGPAARTLALALTPLLLGACARSAKPPNFEVPMESRLILQAPFYGSDDLGGAAGALAEVMTYRGRPVTAEKIALTLKKPTPHALVLIARAEGLKASYYRGTPQDLLTAVREGHPLIVRLGAPAGPLAAGDYAVAVGYGPEGLVVNSRSANQQIAPWGPFLTGWLRSDNLIIEIESAFAAP